MKMTTKKLKKFFEDKGFQVHLTRQDGNQCAEVEKWTTGGVDMIMWLNPFTVEEFKSYVKDFDVDDEIDTHREDPKYRAAFTTRQSLNDFEEYHNGLKTIAEQL